MKKLLSLSVLIFLTIAISGCQKRTKSVEDTLTFKDKIGNENDIYEAQQRELNDINNDYQDIKARREAEEKGIKSIDDQSSLMGEALDAKFKLTELDETVTVLPQTIVKDGSFAHSGFNFKIDYPTSWKASRNILGAVLMITSPKRGDNNFAENINVFVENVPSVYEKQTIDDYMKKALVEMKNGIKDFKLLEQQDILLHGEKAKAYSYTMTSKEDINLKLMLVATIYNHRVYGITYAAPTKSYKEKLPVFKKSLKSFQFLSKLKK